MYSVEFSQKALGELQKMQKSDMQAFSKLEKLIPELREHPYSGTGVHGALR